MKPIALERAARHLELAKEAVATLDQSMPSQDFERAWSEFLHQASRFYSKLEQGAKGCGQSEGWFGRRKFERKNDPLLSYIHHARNSDEHGLERVVDKIGSSVTADIEPGAKRLTFSAKVMLDSDGRLHVRDARTKTPESLTNLCLHNARMELVTAIDSRYGDKFDPPSEHLGKDIQKYDPQVVAELAVQYLEEMLVDAKQLPGQEG